MKTERTGKLVSLPVQKTYQVEQELHDKLLAVVREYDGQVSLVSVLGILEVLKSTIVQTNE